MSFEATPQIRECRWTASYLMDSTSECVSGFIVCGSYSRVISQVTLVNPE